MLLVSLIISLVVGSWLLVAMLRLPLMGWCLSYLLVMCCFGPHFFNYSLGPLPITLDRLVLLAAAATYLLRRPLEGVAPKPLQAEDRLLAALLVLLIASALRGLVWGDPSLRFETGWRLLCGYLMPCTVFWLARQAPLTPRAVGVVHAALIVFGLYLVGISLCETARLWPLVFPRYIADPSVGLHFGRSRGPFVHSVSHGLFLGTCLAATWLMRPTCRRGTQLLLLLAIPLFYLSVLFTYTRSVWLGVGLASLVLLGAALRGPLRVWLLGGLVATTALLATLNLDSILYMQREHSASESAGSVELRPIFAYISWQMFCDRPLLGVGFGQFPTAKLPYLDDHTTSLHLQAIRPYVHHNTYLSLLTETGAVGLALFLAVVGGWGWRAWRMAHNSVASAEAQRHGRLLVAALCVYALQLLFHDLTYTPVDNSLVFFLAGVSEGLYLTTATPSPAPFRWRRPGWLTLDALRRAGPTSSFIS